MHTQYILAGRKTLKTLLKHWKIISTTTTGIFFALKAANVKPPKAFLDAMDIIRFTGRICGGCWWKIIQSTKNRSTSNATKILWPLKGNKITQCQTRKGKCPSYFADLCVQTNPPCPWGIAVTSSRHFTITKILDWH